MSPFQYVTVDRVTPDGYVCKDCGARGVKLWREYQTFLDHQVLRCQACAERAQGRPLEVPGDSIGWLVPAVPTEDGETFWGYTSVPANGVAWWKALPAAPAPGEKDTP